MQITVAAVGRARAGPERDIYDDYVRRSSWPIVLKEVEEPRKLAPGARMASEAQKLLSAIPETAKVIALDERGKSLTSRQLAQLLGRWRDEGERDVAFLIGGADGLDKSLRGSADLVLSFGALTWPHMLVRPLLAEQLYRAQSILSGHPYHRE